MSEDKNDSVKLSKTPKCEDPILIYRQSFHYLMHWFSKEMTEDSSSNHPTYNFYTGMSAAPKAKLTSLAWKGHGPAPPLTKYDYLIIKYLLLKFALQGVAMDDPNQKRVYIEYVYLQKALARDPENYLGNKDQCRDSIKKLIGYKFRMGGSNQVFAFINSAAEWSDGDHEGSIIDLNVLACTSFIAEGYTDANLRRVFYPFNQMLQLSAKSQSVNFYLVLDRILLLPRAYNEVDKMYTTRYTTFNYLWEKRGRREMVWQAIEAGLKSGLIASIKSKITQVLQKKSVNIRFTLHL